MPCCECKLITACWGAGFGYALQICPDATDLQGGAAEFHLCNPELELFWSSNESEKVMKFFPLEENK